MRDGDRLQRFVRDHLDDPPPLRWVALLAKSGVEFTDSLAAKLVWAIPLGALALATPVDTFVVSLSAVSVDVGDVPPFWTLAAITLLLAYSAYRRELRCRFGSD